MLTLMMVTYIFDRVEDFSNRAKNLMVFVIVFSHKPNYLMVVVSSSTGVEIL